MYIKSTLTVNSVTSHAPVVCADFYEFFFRCCCCCYCCCNISLYFCHRRWSCYISSFSCVSFYLHANNHYTNKNDKLSSLCQMKKESQCTRHTVHTVHTVNNGTNSKRSFSPKCAIFTVAKETPTTIHVIIRVASINMV